MAKLDCIEIDKTSYELVPEIAPLFNTSTQYSTGDYVIKDAVLYRFKTAHASGAWSASQVDEVTVGSELKSIINDKLDKNQGTTNAGKYLKVGADGNVTTAELDVTTDKTLSIADKSADAKAVGDKITALESQISSSQGMSVAFKVALENLVNQLAFNGDDPTGRTYIDALHTAMYPPANLTKITAVYTQTKTVRYTDSLDVLKSDLVVNAYYDTGAVETVSDYVLSGSLEAGTSTITVTYKGKVATFTVNVSSVPYYGTFTPDNFVQGYYIESDGTVTASQYGSMSETYYDIERGLLNFACGTNFRVSIYDADKVFIRQIIFNTNSGVSTGNGTLRSRNAAITFRDSEKHFRLSWSSENNVEFTITNAEYTDIHMEIGDVNSTTGEDIVEPKRMRSAEFVPVNGTSLIVDNFEKLFLDDAFPSGSENQYGQHGFLGRCYDSSKNIIGSIGWTTKNGTVTLPANTAFIRPIIQFGNYNIPSNFADYTWIPLLLNSKNYRIVGA